MLRALGLPLLASLSLALASGCRRPSQPESESAPTLLPSLEGRRISAVDLRISGNVPAELEAIRRVIGVRAGEIHRTERVDDDIRSLHETGLVDDIRAILEAEGDEMRITYEVLARQPVGPGHAILGDHVFPMDRLIEAGGFRDWPTMPDFPEAARLRLERFHRRNGYPEARVLCLPQEIEGYYEFVIDARPER